MPLLRNGSDIQTVQELLGNKDVKTTMIYTHILKVMLRELKILTQSLCSESSVVCISTYKEMKSKIPVNNNTPFFIFLFN